MKRYIICLTMFIGCAQVPDPNKAHNTVINFIKSELGEPDSYEPVRWDSIYPIFLEKRYSKPYLDLLDSIDRFDAQSMADVINERSGFKTYDSLKSVIGELRKRLTTEGEGQDSTHQTGYRIRHRYRAKNKHGALEVFEREFELNLTQDTAQFHNTFQL